jgi:hypothetical protein
MAMGNSLPPVVSNLLVYMEHYEETTLDTADHKPIKWLRYVDDTFMVWPHGPSRLQQFLHHLNSIGPTTKFTMKVEANDTLPFLIVFVMTRGFKSAMKVYWKFIHTGHYLHFKSNYPHGMKSPEIGSGSIDWAQLTGIHLKKTESGLRNVVCFK